MHMSTISKMSKYCCTCQHFGGKAILKGSIVEYENSTHICKISGRGNCGQSAMNSACPKWQERKR